MGDSRAVIISEGAHGKLEVFPLSLDQTPYRKDERERCKKAGAVVKTTAQVSTLIYIYICNTYISS